MNRDDCAQACGGIAVEEDLLMAIEFRHFKDAHARTRSCRSSRRGHEPTPTMTREVLQNLPKGAPIINIYFINPSLMDRPCKSSLTAQTFESSRSCSIMAICRLQISLPEWT